MIVVLSYELNAKLGISRHEGRRKILRSAVKRDDKIVEIAKRGKIGHGFLLQSKQVCTDLVRW